MATFHFLFLFSVTILAATVDAFWNGRAVSSFTWRDCGASDALVKFRSLSLTPRPIRMPGNVQVHFDVDFRGNITGSLHADIRLSRKVDLGWFGSKWVSIPTCPLGQLTCLVPICSKVADIVNSQGCPNEVTGNGFDCTCPPPIGSYVTRDNLPLQVLISESDMPNDFLRSMMTGTYRMRVTLKDGASNNIGCFYITQFGLQHHRAG